MKKTWLIPLLLVGMLASCANGEGTEGGQTGGGTGGDTGGETEHGTTETATLPLTYNSSDKFAEGTGWEYVPTDAEHATPDFYSDGGLKINFPGKGIKSATFAAANALNIKITIKAVHDNTKTAKDDILNVFEVEGYNAAGTKVGMAPITKEEFTGAKDYTVSLTGEAITSVKIMFVDFGTIGGKCQNVSLSTAVVSK